MNWWNEFGIEWIGTNDKGELRHGKWRKSNVSQWMKGMVKGYEGPNDMVSEKCRAKDHVSKESKCPIQRIGKWKKIWCERMCGKDTWKWKDGAKASVWRKRRHVLFQSMYEHFVMKPLVGITSRSTKGEWRRAWKRDNDMKDMDGKGIMIWRIWRKCVIQSGWNG